MVDTNAGVTAKLLYSFDRKTTLHVKVLNAGNVRLGSNKDDLQNVASEGIPQVTGDGLRSYLDWVGDVWWISDSAATQIMAYAPGYNYYQDRGKNLPMPNEGVRQNSEDSGNLSTQ